MTRYSKNKGLAGFFKRNAAYLIMIACVLATALIIVVASGRGNPADDGAGLPDDGQNVVVPPDDGGGGGDQEEPVVTDPARFYLPVEYTSIGNVYDPDKFVQLSVGGGWVVNKSVEFLAPQGSAVMSVFDGEVLSVTYDIVDGTVIKIAHGDGLVSVYKYLQKDAEVAAGDKVAGGAVIGYVGVSYNLQYHIGAHLNFSMTENNKLVNPANYLEF